MATSDIPPDTLTLPNEELSIKFAVIGDSGRGTPEQHAIAAQMEAYRKRFDFGFVLMGGDNIYEGPATPEDYRLKFEEPYKPLLDAGVKFYAVLGNHDDPAQIHYPPFHMDGHRYYTFTPPVGVLSKLDTRVRFFALDSATSTASKWLQRELDQSHAEWKIALMHYPLYSSGRYTLRARRQRFALEPSLVAGGIDVAFSGHEHFYQRSRLQNGVLHFISGGRAHCVSGKPGPRRRSLRATITTTISCWSKWRTNSSSFRPSIGRADNRRRLSTPAETADGGSSTYCGHGGPSLISLTLFEDTHPIRDCVCSRGKERFELVEASPCEEIRQLPIAQLTEERGQQSPAALRDRHWRERRAA